MPGQLSAEAKSLLQAKLDGACESRKASYIPGATFVVVDREGDELFAGAGGRRGVDTDVPMSVDSVYWIASCTKIVTAIACMQLVEQGRTSMDDAEMLEKHVPELRGVKVLVKHLGEYRLEEKSKRITLRMLLSHTAGFSYSFFHQGLRDFSRPVGFDEFSGHAKDFMQPLVNQPGERWEYGINYDWVGLVVERVSGVSLEKYFHDYIFKPLGITNMAFLPGKSMIDRLAYMHDRTASGVLSTRDHLLHRALVAKSAEEKDSYWKSGGGGLFAETGEFCRILSMLMNEGKSPCNGTRILEKETVNELFTNQIPQFPNFGRQGVPGTKKDLTAGAADFYPVEGNPPQGFCMAGMLTPTFTGRSENSAWWCGMANLYWWCDREKGIAGMLCAQVLPFGDIPIISLWDDLEKTVYKSLAA